MGAEDFSWIVDGVVGGMSRPGLVMDAADDLGSLRDTCNVRIVITLTERPLPPAVIAAVPDVSVVHLPVPDFAAPSAKTLASATALVRDAEGRGEAVAVHCAAGIGRTGTVLACVLVDRGMLPDEAVSAVRQARPGSIETEGQVDAIYAFAERAHPEADGHDTPPTGDRGSSAGS